MYRILGCLFMPLAIVGLIALLIPAWGIVLFGLVVWLVESAQANAGSWLLWGAIGAGVGWVLAAKGDESRKD